MHRALTKRDLFPNGPLQRLGRRVDCFTDIHSTNSYLLEAALTALDGAVVTAEAQSAGRGRLGRRWLAPRGAAVMLSVLLKCPPGCPLLGLAAMLGAVATAEAIESATGLRARMRWPNDVMLPGGKVAGVLAETRSLEGQTALVLGVGLNCLQQRGHFPAELQGKATSLEIESPLAVDRVHVAQALLAALDAEIVACVSSSAALRCAWRERCDDFGAYVRLLSDGREYAGVIVDILDNGDLTVQTDQGLRRQFAAATTTRNWDS